MFADSDCEHWWKLRHIRCDKCRVYGEVSPPPDDVGLVLFGGFVGALGGREQQTAAATVNNHILGAEEF